MKWCVDFPEESILMIRPSLDALCYSIKPAAKLLGVLLYRYSIRQEHQQDAENINEVATAGGREGTQDTSFYIYRRQSQLVADMVDEITEKTLHDVAIPTLQLLGYLDVDETPIIHKYDLHINVVREALAVYKKSPVELFAFLLGHLQLEKFLIDEQLEEVLINKKKFSLALEKVLIANRKSSNNKRGRKTRQERAAKALSEEPQISLEIDSEIGNKEEGTYGANAPTPAHLKEIVDEKLEEVKTTSGRLRAMKGAAFNQGDVSDSQVDIGNDAEEEETPTEKREAVKIGASHGNDTTVHPGTSVGHNHGLYSAEAHEQIASQHTPGPAALPSAAVGATHGRSHGISSDQAISVSPSLDSEPAQADFPPAGSAASGATTAQASGSGHPTTSNGQQETAKPALQANAAAAIPKRPRGKQPIVSLSLMGSEVMQWIAEIRGAKPRMTAGNVKACNALAECDGVSLESLKAYYAHVDAQKWEVDLLTAAGETGNDKVGFLSFESNWPKLKKKLNGQDEKPQDKYTAASRDEERNERGLQRLRDRIIARGEKPPC